MPAFPCIPVSWKGLSVLLRIFVLTVLESCYSIKVGNIIKILCILGYTIFIHFFYLVFFYVVPDLLIGLDNFWMLISVQQNSQLH